MAFNMAFKKNLITRGALDAINGYYLENNFCKKKRESDASESLKCKPK